MADRQISPGNAHLPSRLCPPHLRPCLPYSYGTLNLFAFSSDMAASYAIPVRRASVLPAASFRFGLTTDTLAVQLTVPAIGPVEDFHLQVGVPCRAHKQNGAYTKSISISPELMRICHINHAILIATHGASGSGADRYSRISSKYIVPAPPGCGLFLSPKPIEIVSTLVRTAP